MRYVASVLGMFIATGIAVYTHSFWTPVIGYACLIFAIWTWRPYHTYFFANLLYFIFGIPFFLLIVMGNAGFAVLHWVFNPEQLRSKLREHR